MKLMRIIGLICYAIGMHQTLKITSVIRNLIQSTEYTTKQDGQPGHLQLQLVLIKSPHHQLNHNNSVLLLKAYLLRKFHE